MKVIFTRQKINAYIMALFFFQFGFLQPISSLVNSQFPIMIFTVILFVVTLFNNRLSFKKYVYYWFLVLSLLFLSNALIYSFHGQTIFIGYVNFVLIGFSGFIFASLNVVSKELFNAFIYIGILNAGIMMLYPTGVVNLDSVNYMRFGYALVPSTIILWAALFYKNEHKIMWLSLALICTFYTIIYGSRGVLVVISIFFILFLINNAQFSKFKKSIVIILGVFFIYILINEGLIIRFIDYINNIGIKTYALSKITMMINKGIIEASSGRELIYEQIIKHIVENPWFGNGVLFSTNVYQITPHNIFLQILLESGIFGLLIWVGIWLYLGARYLIFTKKDKEIFIIDTMVIAIAFGRLFVSSDMWLRPEYWFAISVIWNYGHKNKINIESNVNIKEKQSVHFVE